MTQQVSNFPSRAVMVTAELLYQAELHPLAGDLCQDSKES